MVLTYIPAAGSRLRRIRATFRDVGQLSRGGREDPEDDDEVDWGTSSK
ncbi:unnamed protein product, partial [Ectocarpus sp. 12 AP-2014]